MIPPLEIKDEKVLKLLKIIKERNLYRAFFDNNTSLLCGENDIYDYKLYKNALLSVADYYLLKDKNNYYECLNDAIRLVNMKFYAKKQLVDRLVKRNYQKEVIDQVITNLEKNKLIDDDAFFAEYVEFKVKQGYGPIYIKNKLYELGIDRPVILTYEVQYDLIKRQLMKKQTQKDNRQVFIKKFTTKLIGQGFTGEIISDVLRENSFNSNEEALKKEYEKLYRKYVNRYEEYQLYKFLKQKLLTKGYALTEIEEVMKEGDF